MRRSQRFGPFMVAGLIVAGFASVSAVSAAAATAHPSYPLGNAKHCHAHYFKKAREHRVNGKEIRYIDCVWRPPKAKPKPEATTTTTTATTTQAPPANPVEMANLSASEVTMLSGGDTFYIDIDWDTNGLSPPDGCPTNDLGDVSFSFSDQSATYPEYPVVDLGWPECFANYIDITFDVPPTGELVGTMTYSGGSYLDASGGTVTLEPETFPITLPGN